MRFTRLAMYNFMPYRGIHEIKFPFSDPANVMIIWGDNMRGKTSILNAFRWVLYGKVFDRRAEPIDICKIVNRDAVAAGDWKVSVHLEFEADGVKYDLRREAVPLQSLSKPRRDSEVELRVSLQKNGVVLPANDIPHEINQIAPEQVSRFFLFDGELLQEYEMLLDEGSDRGSRIKDEIEKVLGVPALINGRDELAMLKKKSQKVQARETQHVAALKTTADDLLRLQQQGDALERDLSEHQSEERRLQQEISTIDEYLKSMSAIQRIHESIERLSGQLHELTINEGRIGDERKTLLCTAWMILVRPRLLHRIESLEQEAQQYRRTLRRAGGLDKTITLLEKLMSDGKCDICGQALGHEKAEEYARRLGDLKVQRETESATTDRIGQISEQLTKLQRFVGAASPDRLLKVEHELDRLAIERTRLEGEVEQLREQLRGHDVSEISQNQGKRDRLLQHLGRASENLAECRRKLEQNERQRDQLAKRLSASTVDERARRAATEAGLYADLESVFSGGIDALREQLRKEVEKRATETFLKLTSERSYTALRINDGYGLSILDSQRKEVNLRSAGAEQIVALALIDGLARTAGHAKAVVMDTPLGRLDKKHRDRVMRWLPQAGEQVVLLVHDGEIDRDTGLGSLADHLGAAMRIERVSENESKLVKG